ncbi:MAG: acetolactate synthase small subunit [Clostridiales bacterium]|uniref:Acetolactate synthase small subunit n=1 Tax=Harryflintia acetispora TaxID=1849041 RepID=A0A9X8Y7H9_9FIRM|nr:MULTISPECIES: acetolactate synthase small subunit [Oscillospiraceae]PWM37596.1 MAG: acetolactate synthase small subunit [Clostridiales bacterium]RGB70006.1 acetolactate synthase small subunit [Harryflintia acetispora]TCL42282.1 acetolactate synthase small subunit [Harryflintia acetispora]
METNEKEYVVSVLARNHTGVLLRISGLFSRRCYNIMSIVAAQTEDPGVSQIIIVVRGDERIIRQVDKQLGKLYDVIGVRVLEKEDSVIREYLLLKVGGNAGEIDAIVNIANMFKASILDVSQNTLILELAGDTHTLNSFIELLRPHGILKIIRTGRTAMERGAASEETL